MIYYAFDRYRIIKKSNKTIYEKILTHVNLLVKTKKAPEK